jgi:hypothetical protein
MKVYNRAKRARISKFSNIQVIFGGGNKCPCTGGLISRVTCYMLEDRGSVPSRRKNVFLP